MWELVINSIVVARFDDFDAAWEEGWNRVSGNGMAVDGADADGGSIIEVRRAESESEIDTGG